MTYSCSRGAEIAEALKNGRWPDACERELHAHADSCQGCSDLILVTQAFQRARTEAAPRARFDSASLLWWRAQLRQRNTAVERVGKPITIAQTFAVVVNLLVAVGFVAWQFRRGVRWDSIWPGFFRPATFHSWNWSFAAMRLDWTFMVLIPSLAAMALVSWLVLRLVSEKQ
ncbi:MAG: hypothetical protein ACXVG9_13250 [Terriglobales bacterium]